MPDITPTAQDVERLRESIETLRQEVATIRQEPVASLRSPQLDRFWAAVQEVADSEQMCSVFDRIAREMGGRPRDDNYLVEMDVTVTARVWVPVTAGNAESARERANVDVDTDDILGLLGDARDDLRIHRRTTGDVREGD